MKEQYFVICNGDGDTSIDMMSKKELLVRLKPEEDEDEYFCDYGKVGFLENIKNDDPNYWGDNILIIKGKIIIPKVKEKIICYNVD